MQTALATLKKDLKACRKNLEQRYHMGKGSDEHNEAYLKILAKIEAITYLCRHTDLSQANRTTYILSRLKNILSDNSYRIRFGTFLSMTSRHVDATIQKMIKNLTKAQDLYHHKKPDVQAPYDVPKPKSNVIVKPKSNAIMKKASSRPVSKYQSLNAPDIHSLFAENTKNKHLSQKFPTSKEEKIETRKKRQYRISQQYPA
jgi:hypothetical protein